MTDKTAGQPLLAGSGTARAGAFTGSGTFRSALAWALAAAVNLPLAAYFFMSEGGPANVLFTFAVTATLAALLTSLTRRALFSAVLVAMLVVMVAAAASAKRQMMDMVVHAYDLFFYLNSWATVSYVWSDHRQYIVYSVLLLSLTGAVSWFLWRADPTRVARRPAFTAALLLAAVAAWAASAKGERRHTQFWWEALYVSSFYSSWSETIETLWRGTLLEAAPAATGPQLAIPADCDISAKPPHILLIHQESVVPPSLFPGLSYARQIDPFFYSHDGRMHRMRVETYGGASWLTEFSILAGVSTHSFGGMRQFVQHLMAGKVRDTLPEALARCGYRNVVFYPMLRNFVSNARFYTAVGMPEIYDLKDQGAKTANERDRFYYENALSEIDRHLATSAKPLFTFILTMSAHSPYNYTYMPHEDVPGGGPGTPPEMHEYLRRLSLAGSDLAYLRQELARRYPSERFLLVHYGDHHPMATRTLLGFSADTMAEDVKLANDSLGFITYFSVDGINYRPPPLPNLEVLDVPYLGQVVLEAARLPLSDSWRERKRLMTLCQGRYFGCARQDEILGFHRRLIDSGLVDAR
jgi:phosphoglycerol transferase MdoB-like AlkP superfamily enzyme